MNGVFPKLYKVENVVSKGLQGEEQNKFSQKIAPHGDWIQHFLIITPMLYWLS